MNWVDVTPAQIQAAESWWNARTTTERERDYPRKVYAGAGFFPCGWRVLGPTERAQVAAILINAGLICQTARRVA
jgi:hypothetical protein